MPLSSKPMVLRHAKSILPGMAILATLALTGCFGHKKLSQEASCQEKWDKVKVKFDKKKYSEVKEPLSELISSCPGSLFTEEALFDLAESHFHLEEWIEAETEYSSFLKDFPNSKKYAELARWRLAEVSANQVEPPNRDQTKTLEAIASYETFLDEYPESVHADTAKIQMEKLKDQLVTKQMQIAHLYNRMDEPQAAAIYYKNMLKEFGTRVNQREISLKLAQCYIDMNQFDEAEIYLSKFDGIAKDDPFRVQVSKTFENLAKARSKIDKERKEEQEQSKRQEPM
jgi:outer membrane protein assembly factor BamD